MKHKITLEDKGQDFLEFIVDANTVVDTKPFQGNMWNGAYIPIDEGMVKVGEPCPIHRPPHIKFGFLKYNVIKLEEIEDEIGAGEPCSCGNKLFTHRHSNWIECTVCHKIKVL